MAKRSSGSFFIAERRMLPSGEEDYWLEHTIFPMTDHIYNDCLREILQRKEELEQDQWYHHAKKQYALLKEQESFHLSFIKKLESVKEKTPAIKEQIVQHENVLRKVRASLKECGNEISVCKENYHFSENEIQKYIKGLRKEKYHEAVGSNVVQKLATTAWNAVQKVMHGNARRVYFRKYGQSVSFEDKSANSGIIYHPAGSVKKYPWEHVTVFGKRIRLKPVREKDIWLQKAMGHRICYCRVVRRPHGNHYHYFLQMVMEGETPIKYKMGPQCAGLDPGVSTMTYDADTSTGMITLSRDIAKYQKQVNEASRIYERRRRMANPQNYNPDGTVIRDTEDFRKHWNHTRGTQRAVMQLKTAWRKMSEYVKQSNGYETNRILRKASYVNVESMDYKALQKRAKTCARQEKASVVTDSHGSQNTIHKYKRRKRFGASILKHAPASFLFRLKQKLLRQGGTYRTIDAKKNKASQYDHVKDLGEKHGLSERFKYIDGHLVQRDAYSAFLLHYLTDEETIDREACIRNFRKFLRRQGKCIARPLAGYGDPTGNFGIREIQAV